MLVPDLTFNSLLAVLDLLAVAFLLFQRRRGRSLTVVAVCFLVLTPLTLILALVVNDFFHFRIFGLLRFLGHAGAIHLPLLLVASGWIHGRHRIARGALFVSATVIALIATYAYHVEPYRLEISHHALTSPRLAGLERPITILQVADIQTDRIGRYEIRVIREIRDLSPDLIVFLGDYIQVVDPIARVGLMQEFNRLLKDAQLNPPLGAFAVQGDCERWTGWEALFADTGIETVGNEVHRIELPGASINLIALDLRNSRTRNVGDLRQITGGKNREGLDVYVAHSPDFADQLVRGDQPFLALAGHTHGGQVRIPLFGAPMTFSRLDRRLADAFVRYGPGILSVSRGIGMERHEAPRVRLFCRPELRVITLVAPSEASAAPGAGREPLEIAVEDQPALMTGENSELGGPAKGRTS